jgi:carbonic anhydrase
MNARNTLAFALITAVGLTAAALTASAGDPPAAVTSSPARPNLADHALRMMQEGNDRFVAGKSNHPNTDVFRINDTGSNGQHPFAAIITCADSRVAVERLFDRGVGDLFVVRVAGAICDPNEAGSVEYACEHLGTQLVVVMGHSKCGAVKAAIGGGDAGRNVNSLLDNITPAVQSVKAAHPDLTPDDLVDAVVHENVWQSIEDMFRSSEPMREMVSNGSVKVVGAVYDVQTGRVEWMGSHPMQTALIKSGETTTTTAAKDDKPASVPTAEPVKADSSKPDKDKPLADNKTGFIKPASTARKEPEKKDEAPKDAPAHASHPH